MAQETKLIKPFEERDLSRIRNLIAGKHGEKVSIQVGYETKQEEHVEGDIWIENNKTWTISNGIKQTVTKFDKLKSYIKYPLVCPNCKTHFSLTDLNKKMYNIHEKCFDCVIKMETKLKLEGKYEEYEYNLMNQNRTSYLEEFERALTEYETSLPESHYTEDGQKESWQGGSVDKEYIIKMKEQIREMKSKGL